MPRDVSSQMWPSLQWQKLVLEGNFVKSYHTFTEFNLFIVHLILFWIDELIYFYSIYMSSMNIKFHLWYENCRRHFQMYLQWKCLNFDYNFTEVQIVDIHPLAWMEHMSVELRKNIWLFIYLAWHWTLPNHDNNENDNDKNSSDSMPVTV